MWSWLAELPPPQVPADDARRAAERILARPEYRAPEPSLVQRVLEAIGNFLRDAIGTVSGSGPGGVVSTVVVAVLVAVAVWFLVRTAGAGWRRRPAEPDPVAHGTSAPAGPDAWLDEARRSAAAGEHRQALRCRYQALVATLVRDGVVDDTPGRTARELAGVLVGMSPGDAERIGSVTDRFEIAWYGGRAVTADGYAAFDRDAADVEAVVTSAARSGGRAGDHAPTEVPA